MNARVPEGARWSCHQCAACCKSFDIGPVEPEVIARLQAADIGAVHPPAAAGWLEHRTGPDGATAPFFASPEGACVFLQEDDRCAIHVHLGADAKPGMCRAYPFRVAVDPVGVAITARPTCAGFHESSVTGEPFEARVDEVLALARTQPSVHFHPQKVPVAPGVDVDIAAWPQVEQAVLAALRASSGPPEALVGVVRGQLAGLAGLDAPTPDARRARMALGAVLEGMIRLLAQVVEAGPPPGVAVARHRFITEMAASLPRVQRVLDDPPALAEDATTWANLLLRSAILSKEVHALGSMAAGVALWELGVRFARLDAALEGPVSAASLSASLTRWEQLVAVGAVRQLLRRASPALVDAFLYLP